MSEDGKRTPVESRLVAGVDNIVFFHAPWSKTSSRYKIELEEWSRKNPEANVLGVLVPNLKAPVAEQFGLKQVPAFLIYDKQGLLTHSGSQATAEVLKRLAR